jgi:hypothetical protein
MSCSGLSLNRPGSLAQVWQMNSLGGQATQGLEPASMVVGVHEQLQMGPELVVAVVGVALDGGVVDLRFMRST